MKKFLNVTLTAAVFGLMIFSSCSKGTTGPAGPQGPAGPDSVIHSPWLVLAMHDTTFPAGGGLTDTVFVQLVHAPAITQRILDSGVVLCYLAYLDGSGNTHIQNADVNMFTDFAVGDIYLETFGNADYSGVGFRYVVIPGSMVATIQSITGKTKQEIGSMTEDALNKTLQQAGVQTTTLN